MLEEYLVFLLNLLGGQLLVRDPRLHLHIHTALSVNHEFVKTLR